ncbi:MAG TPA: hypothetical protein VFC18_00725 [Burkholderiales bacterium]|nr:hypothetical protein [Burkholderiales bacterium]
MKMKSLIGAFVAAGLAMPIAVWAQSDKPSSGASGSAASGASSSGAEQMFKALDKDTDGYISKEEAKGTPHGEDFATLDKDGDGKLSREEHAAAPEHAGEKSGATGAGATGSGTPSGGGASGSKKY